MSGTAATSHSTPRRAAPTAYRPRAVTPSASTRAPSASTSRPSPNGPGQSMPLTARSSTNGFHPGVGTGAGPVQFTTTSYDVASTSPGSASASRPLVSRPSMASAITGA